MTFSTEVVAGTGGVRQRMKSALGRWTAQYQEDTPASACAVMDQPEEPILNGDGGDCEAPERDGTKSEPEAQASGATSHDAQTGAAGGDRPEEKKEQGSAESRPEDGARQEQEGNREYARFEPNPPPLTDYYEVLQVSRNADPETIHRVYRIMVARFHPDNPRTGDAERFQLLRRAYHVLSDAVRRADYDRTFLWAETHTLPIFEMKEFVDGIDGEKNRRLGILSLLYHRRRLNEEQPGVSVLDLEHRMGFPREYLTFTLWYLKSKNFVRCEDNSDYGVTVEGVDYLEANSLQNTIIRELLEAGTKGETCTSTCGQNN
jgi:hypothetical protein